KAYGNESQYRPVRVPPGLTLARFLDNALRTMGRERFFVYEAFSTNCQDFILNLLHANRMLTPQLQSFIYQDVAGIAKELGGNWIRLFQAITDTAAVVTAEK